MNIPNYWTLSMERDYLKEQNGRLKKWLVVWIIWSCFLSILHLVSVFYG